MQLSQFSHWKCLFVFSLLISFGHTSAKADNIDSLVNLLTIYETDTNRVRVLTQLTKITLANQAKTAQQYGEEALALAKSINDLKGQTESLFLLSQTNYGLGLYDLSIQTGKECIQLSRRIDHKLLEADAMAQIGRTLFVTGNIDSAEVYYQKCQKVSEIANYPKGIAKGLYGQGNVFESRGKYDKAMELFELSLKISTENKDIQGQLSAHNAIGIIHEYKGHLEKSLAKYIETLRLAEKETDWSFAARANGNIASLYFIQKNHEKAIEYGLKGLEIYNRTNNQRGIAFSYHDMGNVLKAQRKLDEALENYQKALKIRIALNDKRGQSFTYFSMAWNYKHQKNLDKARFYMRKSLALREEIGFNSGIHACNKALAQWNMAQGNYKVAFPYLKKAYDWYAKAGELEGMWESSSHLVEYYERQGDFKNAFRYQQLNLAAKDSLFNKDQNKQFADMQTLYETEKKDKVILEKENAILKLGEENGKIERQLNYLLGGTLLLSIFGFLGFKFNKIRRERNDKIAFAKALIFAQEEERKRIARDLHDGIGQSLLLIKKQLTYNHEVTLENQQLITDTLEEVRSISQDLHPIQLEKFGLTTAINEIIQKVEKSTDLFISKEIDNIDKLLNAKAEINLYRTIQEAFNNIVKHSEATAAKISIKKVDKNLIINIQDNGKGFDYKLAVVTSKSLGLRTMFERITAIGGQLKLKKGVTKGAMVLIRIPV